jgi:hypothetical protein
MEVVMDVIVAAIHLLDLGSTRRPRCGQSGCPGWKGYFLPFFFLSFFLSFLLFFAMVASLRSSPRFLRPDRP